MRNYLQEINEIDQLIAELRDKRATVIDQWIDNEHPLKVGDVVEANGYSHIGKQMVVKGRSVSIARSRYDTDEWNAHGIVLKKDGTPGQMRGEWRKKMEGK